MIILFVNCLKMINFALLFSGLGKVEKVNQNKS